MTEIRPLNGYDYPLSFVCISLSDTFDKFDFELFKKEVIKEIVKYSPFHLDIRMKDGHPFWYKFDDNWLFENSDIFVVKIPFKETGEVEPAKYDLHKEGTPLFCIEYSENDVVSRVKLYANHAICDGRTIANLYQIIKNAIPNEFHMDFNDEELYDYDYRTLYKIEDKLLETNPKCWDIPKVAAVPPITDKCEYINMYNSFDCQKVISFCKKNKIGVQALLMASQERATRRFMKFDNSEEISVYCPSDTRISKYADDKLKHRNFYCAAGANFPSIVGKENLMEDIKECNYKIREAMKTTDCCVQVLMSFKQIDEKTLVFTPIKNAPDLSKMRIITCSNIGLYDHMNDPYLGVLCPCDVNSFSVVLYSWHSKNHFHTLFFFPEKLNKDFVTEMKHELENVMKFVCEN
ncbi:hypothetical protein EIN_508940 [Entamoeba invadens IP1]|uniref:Uncharacterized protein n=1 Tax=Entamoeba invadens IP1 TaxID=370355 RepID=A0A0A1UCA9_ENTIV|nr:hypothetical protein EIN_508940 [Entamoeba invadens IP1]ELP92883.1 hypothetical protein EIN_508940 [Entamoeba invadens IP1]|eukprot:XP_004259654.1 hypothetical protein EIN_508940 [Entamoeba invadens IP1]